MILDFEQPNPEIEWVANTNKIPATAPASEPATTDATEPATAPMVVATAPATQEVRLARSSLRAKNGLWALKFEARSGESGVILHRFAKAVSLSNYDLVSAGVMHLDLPNRSGQWRAAVVVEDLDGKRVIGDRYPVTSKWTEVTIDLKTAAEEGVDLTSVTAVGIELTEAGSGSDAPLAIQTDEWTAETGRKSYVGNRLGAAKSFYVERVGGRLLVGSVGQYAITFFERAGTERPWMTVEEGSEHRKVLGEHGTGICLLDAAGFEEVGKVGGIRQSAYSGGSSPINPPSSAVQPPPFEGGNGILGEDLAAILRRNEENSSGENRKTGTSGESVASWPSGSGASSQWRWECVWTSSVGAIVEVRQEVGPYDRLGQPAAELKWRFMIYQWGEIFVHVDYSSGQGSVAGGQTPPPPPITWALVLDSNVMGQAGGVTGNGSAERLLSEVYPVSAREQLSTALPHEMQTGAPVAMVAKPNGRKDAFWWAEGGGRKYFGVGFSGGAGGGHSRDCMLLVNSPTALTQAGSFAQYLAPPKVRVRQGELDRNFPGDADNDGLVEGYGFQVIRLANGRTSFVIYPQERPLFYPAYMFTVPAAERDLVDLKNSRVLVNIDGKQFADPPQFPDGSFLLQMPYVIDRVVTVEAVVVRK